MSFPPEVDNSLRAETAVSSGAASESSAASTLRRLLATLISAACPGAGHLILGRLSVGMFLSALFAMLVCCYWPLRLLRYYAGFITLIVTWGVLGVYSACSNQLIRSPGTGRRVSKWWFALTLPAALMIVSLTSTVLARASGFRPFTVPSTSMEPTIQRGDHIMVDTRAYRFGSPQYRDVVVFRRDGLFIIKRIIGIGGDTLEGRSDRILLNGNLINESYIQHSDPRSALDWDTSDSGWLHSFGPLTVPPSSYFVMGDNRDVSLDSRSPDYGFVDGGSIIGKVLYVYSAAREGIRVR